MSFVDRLSALPDPPSNADVEDMMLEKERESYRNVYKSVYGVNPPSYPKSSEEFRDAFKKLDAIGTLCDLCHWNGEFCCCPDSFE